MDKEADIRFRIVNEYKASGPGKRKLVLETEDVSGHNPTYVMHEFDAMTSNREIQRHLGIMLDVLMMICAQRR